MWFVNITGKGANNIELFAPFFYPLYDRTSTLWLLSLVEVLSDHLWLSSVSLCVLEGDRNLSSENPELKKCYWGRHFWAIGYGCWSSGNNTDEMVNTYLEHHRKPTDNSESNFIIE